METPSAPRPAAIVIPFSRAEIEAKVERETIKAFGFEHVEPMKNIIKRESNFNPKAQNSKSSAFGMFQFLDSTWASYGCKKTESVSEQIGCGIKYISKRYGNPQKAWNYWKENNYY